MIAATGMATSLSASASRQARSISCPELQLFGVRGSGERHSDYSGFGKTIWDVQHAVQEQLPTSSAAAIDYPAIPVVLPTSKKKIPSFLHYILTGYHTSEIRGIKALSKLMSSFVASCPVSYLALAGYSQGAQVVGDTYLSHMTAAQRSRVVGIVMLGDPDFNGSAPVDRGTYSKRRTASGPSLMSAGLATPNVTFQLHSPTVSLVTAPRAIPSATSVRPMPLLAAGIRPHVHMLTIRNCGGMATATPKTPPASW
jgi:hypothetical protein